LLSLILVYCRPSSQHLRRIVNARP